MSGGSLDEYLNICSIVIAQWKEYEEYSREFVSNFRDSEKDNIAIQYTAVG